MIFVSLQRNAKNKFVVHIPSIAPVTVVKTSGDDRISWNNTTKQLDISEGLPMGVYEVKLRASNSVSTFTLRDAPTGMDGQWIALCKWINTWQSMECVQRSRHIGLSGRSLVGQSRSCPARTRRLYHHQRKQCG